MRTRRDGSWSLPLAAGPSRTLTVSHTAFAGDPKPADTARVRVDVRAGARLTPSAPRLRNGDTLVLRGRLLGAPLPRSGKLVDVQAWDLGKWRTFAVARADRAGRFEVSYASCAPAPRRPARCARSCATRTPTPTPRAPRGPCGSP